jgi:hypothetical protein
LAYTLVKECTYDHETFKEKRAAWDKEKRASETVRFWEKAKRGMKVASDEFDT